MEEIKVAVEQAKPIEGLTEGRIVHYVTDTGKHRPAIIVQVWDTWSGCSNLQVFTDGTNDGFARDHGLTWITSIEHSITPNPNTWHFIERA